MTPSTVCTLCGSKFSMALNKQNAQCPYCGNIFSSSDEVRREHIRESIEEGCAVSNGFGSISGVTIDTSISGAGIKVYSLFLPFKKDDMIDFAFAEEGEKILTQVMWLKEADDKSSRVGLRFNSLIK